MCSEKMKKFVLLFVLCCCIVPSLRAFDGCEQRLSREEFRTRQKEFLAKEAGLTTKEAKNFFPLYFELQDKKKELNDESWRLMRQGENGNLAESEYAKIIEKVCDNRIAADELDKNYIEKFKKVISSRKIFLLQRAETRFHREMLRGMNHKENPTRKRR